MILESRIPEIVAELKAKAKLAEHAGAEAWLDEAQARAPELTGALKDSGHIENDSEVVFDAVNEQGHPYPAYVEFGTEKTLAQPFFRPAEDVAKAKFQADLTAEMETL